LLQKTGSRKPAGFRPTPLLAITCVDGHCAGMGGEASGEDGLRRAVGRLELPGCDDVDGGVPSSWNTTI
jgi:hypothetical protein